MDTSTVCVGCVGERERAVTSSDIARLPNALQDGQALSRRMADKRLAVFLDYDGTLTPIVERPDDALISSGMRAVVRELARPA